MGEHKSYLLDLGVREHPVSSNLLDIQAIFGENPRIGGSDVRVAAVVDLVSRDKSVPLESLKDLPKIYKHEALAEVIYDDLRTPRTGEEGNFAHCDIPRQTLFPRTCMWMVGGKHTSIECSTSRSRSRFHQAEDPLKSMTPWNAILWKQHFGNILQMQMMRKPLKSTGFCDNETISMPETFIAPSMKHFQGPAFIGPQQFR